MGSPANLFAYANNSPADMRDPTGLLSIGVSAYLGIGGGVNFGFGWDGWSYCGEMGVGLGVSAEADPFADPAEAGDTNFGEAGGKAGFWGGGLAAEQSDCPPYGESDVKVTAKVSGGPITVAVDSENGMAKPAVSGSADAIELKAQGKAGKRRCINGSWGWS
jgi:hypothetical protein